MRTSAARQALEPCRRRALARRRAPARRRRARDAGVVHPRVGLQRRAGAPDGLVGDDPVEQLAVEVGHARRRCSSSAANAMNAAVGPFSTSPPTIGLTATTGACGALQRLADARARRGSGRSRRAGSTGRSRSRGRAAIAASACALGRACSAPRNSRPSTGPAARSRIMNSWKERHPRAVRIHVRTGSSLIGSTRAPHAERLVQARERRGRGEPLGEQPRALEAPREVAVAEVEPHLRAERRAARPSP